MNSTNGYRPSIAVIPSGIKDGAILATKRAGLVAVATDLFIDRGFNEVSVNEIAAAANISVGSLYKYIRAKEDLLWLVMESIYGKLEELLMDRRANAKDPVEALEDGVRQLHKAVHEVRRGVLLMYREYRRLPVEAQQDFMNRERRVVTIFAEIIREGNERGVFHCDDPDLAALDLLAGAHAWSLKSWMVRDVSLDDYVKRQLRLMFAMVGRSRGGDHAGVASSPWDDVAAADG